LCKAEKKRIESPARKRLVSALRRGKKEKKRTSRKGGEGGETVRPIKGSQKRGEGTYHLRKSNSRKGIEHRVGKGGAAPSTKRDKRQTRRTQRVSRRKKEKCPK